MLASPGKRIFIFSRRMVARRFFRFTAPFRVVQRSQPRTLLDQCHSYESARNANVTRSNRNFNLSVRAHGCKHLQYRFQDVAYRKVQLSCLNNENIIYISLPRYGEINRLTADLFDETKKRLRSRDLRMDDTAWAVFGSRFDSSHPCAGTFAEFLARKRRFRCVSRHVCLRYTARVLSEFGEGGFGCRARQG